MTMQEYIDWLKSHDMRGNPIDNPQPTGPLPSIDPNSRIDQAGDAVLGYMNPLNRITALRGMNNFRNAMPSAPSTPRTPSPTPNMQAPSQGSSGVPNVSNAPPQMQPFQFPQGGPSGPTSSLPPGYLTGELPPLPFKPFQNPWLRPNEQPVPIPNRGSSGVPNVPQSNAPTMPRMPNTNIPSTITAITNAPQVPEQPNYDNWPDRVRQMPTGPMPQQQTTPPARRPVPTPPERPQPQTYYLDRGDGSPVVLMGQQLPKGMEPGAQQGGGYIFGLNQAPPANTTQKVIRGDFTGDSGMASGGAIDHAHRIAKEKATPCHSGIINMAVGGRTDHIPMNVLEGSYVLPADIVSGLGEGNTLAGSKVIDNMFKSGPFGTRVPEFRASSRFPSPGYQMKTSSPYEPVRVSADGGKIEHAKNSRPVPIIAAGGEYVVHPEVVQQLGGGDMDAGHKWLDNFVKYVREHTVKTLRKLPPPRKD